jgi:hypothetical protein
VLGFLMGKCDACDAPNLDEVDDRNPEHVTCILQSGRAERRDPRATDKDQR